MLRKYTLNRDVTTQVHVVSLEILSVNPKQRTAHGKVRTNIYTCSIRKLGKQFHWSAEWSPDKNWQVTVHSLFAPGLNVGAAKKAVGGVIIATLCDKVRTDCFELPADSMFRDVTGSAKAAVELGSGGTAERAAVAETTLADDQRYLDSLLHKKGRHSNEDYRTIRELLLSSCVLPNPKKTKFLPTRRSAPYNLDEVTHMARERTKWEAIGYRAGCLMFLFALIWAVLWLLK